MRRAWIWLFCLCVAASLALPAAAQDQGDADAGPSLEYRPPRQVLPEPRAPTPAPPVSIFRESFGNFGIGAGSFDAPVDVAADDDGNFYVLDAGNSRVQKFDRSSNFLLEWGGSGSRSGEFSRPTSIAVGPGSYVYVVDTGNNRVQQFKRDGTFVSKWGSLGSRSGDFKNPRDITFEAEEFIWVLDVGNERVQKFRFDPATMAGRPPEFVGEFGRDLGTRGGSFTGLVSLAWSDERFGYLYLLGPGCVVQQFKSDGTLEQTWAAVAPESGACVPARIRSDNVGRYLYVLDAGNGLLSRFHREGRFLSAVRGAERVFSKPGGFAVIPGRDQFAVADTANNIVQKFTLR